MLYKLINKYTEHLPLIQKVLLNRGITDYYHYLNVTEDDLNDPSLLNNIEEASAKFLYHLKNHSKTIIVVDSDTDGFTSAATLLNYIYQVDSSWKVDYIFHLGKQHGLSDVMDQVQDYEFVIIPDAGSNNIEEVDLLNSLKIDSLIIDHHEAEVLPNTTVINPQTDNYPNKTLSGAGVVWKFLQYIDKINQWSYSECLLDLVAVGIGADMMDLRDYETHYMMYFGLRDIYNPFLLGVLEKNSYTLKSKLNPKAVGWTIAPLVNAVNRAGTNEEKELLFQSMLWENLNKTIPSTKRGAKPGDTEKIVDAALRMAGNVRNRQNRNRDNIYKEAVAQIEENNLLDNKILVIKCDDSIGNIAGLIANQITGNFHRPSLVLRRVFRDNEYYWEGSARNPDGYGIDNLRAELESCATTEFCSGHGSAFGISIAEKNLDKFIEETNLKFANVEYSQSYLVDDVIEMATLDLTELNAIIAAADIWGQGVEQPMFYFKNITFTANDVFTTEKLLSIKINEELSLVKFFPTEEERWMFARLYQRYTINAVGTFELNSYNNTKQIVMAGFEKVDTNMSVWDF